MDYSRVRGFNYQPSYGSHGLEIWGDAFNLETIKREIGLGKKYFPGINTIRLWLSHDAFVRNGHAVSDRFHAVVDLADEFDVRLIPTLFNGWHSCPDFGGISYEMVSCWGIEPRFDEVFSPYIENIVKPHDDDDRILLWDLCNEPFNNAPCDATKKIILEWLQRVHRRCKDCGARAPLGIGSVPGMASIRLLEPISDVITFHPYFRKTPEQLEKFVDEVVAFSRLIKKPILATETGKGALDDKKRSEILTVELKTLATRGIGFTAHLLHHTLVADGHRPEDGPESGYMAFIEKNGSLRPFHDIFNKF